jgi:2-polyprenyl-3-methyl-5-hydroxy-6-metoxy-1,4-benzoquinol methylase
MMEVIHSSEMPVLTTATQHHIPQGANLHSDCNENLKSYTMISEIAEFQVLIAVVRKSSSFYNIMPVVH